MSMTLDVDRRVVAPVSPARLRAEHATIGYHRRPISTDLSVSIPDGSFTVIIGPNACGKSTLLRALSRLLSPSSGQVILDGREIRSYKAKEVARRLGLLPQTSHAPDGIRVADLVARGRYPHQGLIRQWTAADERAVADAMAATGVTDLSGRLVDELSGGQRQRVWVAMALAQQTELLLLDEPTTFLDIAHQIELLELFTDLHLAGRTLVAVLHDLNQAARYATHLIAMRDGRVVGEGPPERIVTAELVEAVFGIPCLVAPDPVTGLPAVTPLGRDRAPSRPPPVGKDVGPRGVTDAET
jgi:iron complex transport system ATP-binding protein